MTKFVRRVMMVRSDSVAQKSKRKKKKSSTMNMYGGLKIQMPKFDY